MATIKPFKGLRPAAHAEKIACPPYDVLNSAEAREMAKGNSISFLHIDKPEIDLPENIDLYAPEVYQKAKENLDKFIHDRILVRDPKEYFYLYAQTMDGRTQYGLVAAASCDEYDKGIVRKHELTRKDKEDDRTRHVNTLSATTGPVFLTYPDNKQISAKIAEIAAEFPVYEFTTDDHIKHALWVIDNPQDIAFLTDAFKEIPTLYIADGHHRSAAASNVARQHKAHNSKHTGNEKYNFFLSVIFPASQLYVMDYNRVVQDLNGLTEKEFLAKIGEKFTVEETGQNRPPQRHTFGMYLGGKWYTLTAKKGTFNPDDPVDVLDVSILQNNLLRPVLGIGDPRTDKRISFVGGIRGLKALEERVNQNNGKVAFSMFPTSMNELMKVADAHQIMPPKSTWFEPKLRSGLVIYTYDD